MTNYSGTYHPHQTPQSVPLAGENQVRNDAGGYVYAVDKWTQLDRFIILGNEGGSYYTDEQTMTRENATGTLACIKEDGVRVVKRVIEISEAGRAPKNDPAIFVLSLAASEGDEATRTAALHALARVARTGTHLFHFLEDVGKYRGWGRGLRTAVAQWYLQRPDMDLAVQLTKYKQRDGWSHRDALRLAHPATKDATKNALLRFATKGEWNGSTDIAAGVAAYMQAVEQLKSCSVSEGTKLIVEHRLPREVIPTEWLTKPEVWEALLQHMPMTAMIRNLGNMSKVGLLSTGAIAVNQVVNRLNDETALHKARIHPMGVLLALNTYSHGHGFRGTGSWKVEQKIVDALDAAFYKAFKNVVPTNKRLLLGLDWSGSMSSAATSNISAAMGAAAMALITAATEPNYSLLSFATSFKPISISPGMRLDQVMRVTAANTGEGTDCSVPIRYALSRHIPVDAFVIYTDSQTWHGQQHPVEALREYRKRMDIPAKLIVAQMVASGYSIADLNDAGSLNIVGLDASVPELINNFVAD